MLKLQNAGPEDKRTQNEEWRTGKNSNGARRWGQRTIQLPWKLVGGGWWGVCCKPTLSGTGEVCE